MKSPTFLLLSKHLPPIHILIHAVAPNALLGKKSNMERNVANIYSFTYLSLVKQREYLRHQVDVFLPQWKLNSRTEQNTSRFLTWSLSLFFLNQLLRNFLHNRSKCVSSHLCKVELKIFLLSLQTLIPFFQISPNTNYQLSEKPMGLNI